MKLEILSIPLDEKQYEKAAHKSLIRNSLTNHKREQKEIRTLLPETTRSTKLRHFGARAAEVDEHTRTPMRQCACGVFRY